MGERAGKHPMRAIWAKVVLPPHGLSRREPTDWIGVDMKKCSGCEGWKALDQFGKDPSHKDGLRSRCRVCRAADGRTARGVNPEKHRAAKREHYAASPEKVCLASRNYRANNLDKTRVAKRIYRADNPEVGQLGNHRYRARMQENEVFLVTPKEIKAMLAKPCYLCSVAPSTDIEHIIPVSRGGRWAIGGLLGACKPCNSRKKDMLLVEYRQYQRRLLEVA